MERKKSWLAIFATLLLCCAACPPADASERPHVPVGSVCVTTPEESQILSDREAVIKLFYAQNADAIESEEAPAEEAEDCIASAEGEESQQQSEEEPTYICDASDTSSNDQEAAEQPLSDFSRSACGHCGSSKRLGFFGYDVYPDGYLHHVMFCSAGGYTAELEDGSIWRVNDYDAAKLYNWFPQDEISICPASMLSSDPFYLHNAQTRESVGVRLQLGPYYDSHFARWIVAINYITREVWLNDGSHFLIAGDDGILLSEWLPNQTLIIGTNTGLASYKWPNILINVNTYNPLKVDPNPYKRNSLYVQARWVY